MSDDRADHNRIDATSRILGTSPQLRERTGPNGLYRGQQKDRGMSVAWGPITRFLLKAGRRKPMAKLGHLPGALVPVSQWL